MQRIDGRFLYSASDLNNYLECRRLIELDELVALGTLARPQVEDEQAELVRRKGEEHERRFLETMQQLHGERIVSFSRPQPSVEAFASGDRQTRAAMAAGAPLIYQATFFDGTFVGHADFLRRIEVPSNLGDWSYEVLDTKLALSTKPYFLVQLCNYSEHVARLQGVAPDFGYLVLGNGEERRYRLHDFAAYYRHLKSSFLAFARAAASGGTAASAQYPYECPHCNICAWDAACTKQRTGDDHLSIVAGMRRAQITKLEDGGIATIAALARAPDALRPEGMTPETFVKLRRQASLQVRGRTEGPVYELLHHAPPMGFALMPQPAPGDVFFDMEGDPLYEPAKSLEYLFGCWLPGDEPQYRCFWALDRAQEKQRFEEFVDFIVERRRRHPSMHVHHYASYEKVALRRLAQSHCTREAEIDDLLRGEVLVDLFSVVRQAVAISEDGYGLKKLESFYPLQRLTEVKKGDQSIVMFERWLLEKNQAILDDIEAYNRDDCRSTWMLREWLLARREQAVTTLGLDVPLRAVKLPGEPCHPEFAEGCATCKRRRDDLREDERRSDIERELLEGLMLTPQSEDEYRAMPEPRRLRFLLANLLAYHRREEKPAWWQYFDRRESVDRLREFDREAIGDLRLREDIPPERIKRSLVFTYEYPDQFHKLAPGDTPHDPLDPKVRDAGTIVTLDEERCLLGLKRGNHDVELARAIHHLIPGTPLATPEQRKALRRIAEAFLAGDLANRWPATFDLLASRAPRVAGKARGASLQPARADAPAISAVVRALDRSYLFVQGPPGSGKTTKGAQVICDLLQLGKRVAIASTGHKAMHHLLDKVEDEMFARGGSFRGSYKHSDANADSEYRSKLERPFVISTRSADEFAGFSGDLAAGTSWLFAREDLVDVFDYLFIDEAGQVALADALAVSPCAKNVVLLGDPSQLAQVNLGVHPPHAGGSVLQHLLGDAHTVSTDRGIFLDRTYRLQPAICAYISDAMYDERLQPDPLTAEHAVIVGGATRAGLEYIAVEHAGNASSSPEEAGRIVQEIERLLNGSFVDSQPLDMCGVSRPIRAGDIMVVTPYNAQRRLIRRKLDDAGISVEVGTVDKFQGREAAVVFYSMATSSGEEVPRDLKFLLEQNRFNVAISRARALSVLVCSPRLLDVGCRTVEQMVLANLLCAFVEQARAVEAPYSEQAGIVAPAGGS